MTLQFFNTLTRKKEEFKPLEEGKVSMYSCGPTVYNFVHIGNLRAYIFNDLLKRFLKYKTYAVTHVMNITDVDDKTIRDSQKEGKSLKEFTQHYTQEFLKDIDTLNIERPDVLPNATDYIEKMVALIQKIIEKGHAYEKNGTVYYKIASLPKYGELACLNLEQLKKNADGRLNDADEYEKDDARDFALWKAYDKEDGDVAWDSPWGKGRPGWHIECSVMSMDNLGEHFDIHTGGVDLIFPHHTNEIAQSEGVLDKKWVNYWIHNAHLIVNGEKMSKSAGNFFTLRDLLDKGHDPQAIRWAMLSVHYRQQLNFTFEGIAAAKHVVQRFHDFLDRLDEIAAEDSSTSDVVTDTVLKAQRDFEDCLDDDLNISGAIAAVFELMSEINRLIEKSELSGADALSVKETMLRFDGVLGIMMHEKVELDADIEALVQQREDARMAKDWATADRIRDELKEKGIVLEDTSNGIRWKRA